MLEARKGAKRKEAFECINAGEELGDRCVWHSKVCDSHARQGGADGGGVGLVQLIDDREGVGSEWNFLIHMFFLLGCRMRIGVWVFVILLMLECKRVTSEDRAGTLGLARVLARVVIGEDWRGC